MIRVATTGLAYLLELGARDNMAGARRSKRHDGLVTAIQNFNEEQAAYREAARKTRVGQVPPPAQVTRQLKPAENITVDEARKRIRARVKQQKVEKP